MGERGAGLSQDGGAEDPLLLVPDGHSLAPEYQPLVQLGGTDKPAGDSRQALDVSKRREAQLEVQIERGWGHVRRSS